MIKAYKDVENLGILAQTNKFPIMRLIAYNLRVPGPVNPLKKSAFISCFSQSMPCVKFFPKETTK